jgi:hypothetical protein
MSNWTHATSVVRIAVSRHVVAVDVPHLLLLALLGGFCVWYLGDTRAASTNVQNLLLIEPVAVLGMLLVLLLLPTAITISPVAPAPREFLPRSTLFKVVGSMLLLAAFVAAMPYAGFDGATAAYVCGSLFVLGERRLLILIIVPALFAFVATQLFRLVVPIHIPMLINLA